QGANRLAQETEPGNVEAVTEESVLTAVRVAAAVMERRAPRDAHDWLRAIRQRQSDIGEFEIGRGARAAGRLYIADIHAIRRHLDVVPNRETNIGGDDIGAA